MAFTFKTRPRDEQASFLTECVACRGEISITNGRPERHQCEPAQPITLADLRAALDNR
ncbi:hypothetical protein ArV2_gp55 [Arthrobacter phage vB_ArS-ArV2]|uniref:Uncharacterized protein n=1 Tax=Arthrobacter phage vB_ArS-ArV2 TaxID=1414742 RepID=V5R8T2_9CAUD|nr:hypothetical protein ArV2_gp55 [Arthrobacter phage vB_ArS-ArV2]AHB31666.1 hypothetical protein ArV2_gp55 [Arthrobacter phage vB_ArS-ArV2]